MRKGKLRCDVTDIHTHMHLHMHIRTYLCLFLLSLLLLCILSVIYVCITALAMEQYIVPIEDTQPVYSDLQVVQVPHDEVGVSSTKTNNNSDNF